LRTVSRATRDSGNRSQRRSGRRRPRRDLAHPGRWGGRRARDAALPPSQGAPTGGNRPKSQTKLEGTAPPKSSPKKGSWRRGQARPAAEVRLSDRRGPRRHAIEQRPLRAPRAPGATRTRGTGLRAKRRTAPGAFHRQPKEKPSLFAEPEVSGPLHASLAHGHGQKLPGPPAPRPGRTQAPRHTTSRFVERGRRRAPGDTRLAPPRPSHCGASARSGGGVPRGRTALFGGGGAQACWSPRGPSGRTTRPPPGPTGRGDVWNRAEWPCVGRSGRALLGEDVWFRKGRDKK
jgi:hypothetical protein